MLYVRNSLRAFSYPYSTSRSLFGTFASSFFFFLAFFYTSKVCHKLILPGHRVFTLTYTKPQALCACVDNPKKSIRTHLNFYWPLKRQIFSKSFLIIYCIFLGSEILTDCLNFFICLCAVCLESNSHR